MATGKKTGGRDFKKGEDPRRNTKGRPPRGQSIAEIMRAKLGEIDPETGKRKEDLLAEEMLKQALGGDKYYAKLIWNYNDGLPKQTVDLRGGMDLNHELSPELREIIDEMKELGEGEETDEER